MPVVVGGQPVRISSMVLLVAYAFYYINVFSIITYHHMLGPARRVGAAPHVHVPKKGHFRQL